MIADGFPAQKVMQQLQVLPSTDNKNAG